MSSNLIKKRQCMDTTFIINAHKWTQKSVDSINEKKYFQAWLDALCAKPYYLADLITNVCMIPFSLIKILFGSVESLYTWGHETKILSKAIENLYDYTNNSISSLIGVFSINLGKSLKNENNVKKVLSLSFIISMISLTIFSISKADGVYLSYNSSEGRWEPCFYWDFQKLKHF